MSYGKSTGIQTIYTFDQMVKYEGDDYYTLFFDVEFRNESPLLSFHKFMLARLYLERVEKQSEELSAFSGLNDKHSYEKRSEVKYEIDEERDVLVLVDSEFSKDWIVWPFSDELKKEVNDEMKRYIDSLIVCEN